MVFSNVLLIAGESTVPFLLSFVALHVFSQLELKLGIAFLPTELLKNGNQRGLAIFQLSPQNKAIIVWDF